MSLLRKKSDEPETTVVVEDSTDGESKGRPTPKRRTRSAPPTPAPRTRKEAAAWQKAQRTKQVQSRKTLTGAQYRDAVKAGDPAVLPRREQGPVRALARDYVDSHRMLSNYLLLMFALFVVGFVVPVFQYATIFVFLIVLGEWFIIGGRIRRLAVERGLPVKEGAMTLGFYAGSRAYFPRSWRRPHPRVTFGDKI